MVIAIIISLVSCRYSRPNLADECFKTIINMGRYELLNNYADLYRYDNPNTKESLFELQFNNVYPDCNYW